MPAPATRIPVFRNPSYSANAIKSYVCALNKFNITPTRSKLISRDGSNRLMMQAADGSAKAITADNQLNDVFYTCPIQIGTPAQTLALNFDTGSADTWVWSTDLPSSILSAGEHLGNKVFDPAQSSTFEPAQGATWQIQYGDQSTASGTVGFDTLKLGDISVEGQAIELADNLSQQFAENYGSGLLGLSWGSINNVEPQRVKTPVENMIAQKDISEDQELFTAYLGSVKDANDPDQGKSFYTFGAIDQDVVKSSGQEIHYVPVDNKEGFWMFNSGTATVDGQEINLAGNRAMADTGTTLAMVSDKLCDAIYSQIKGAKLDEQQGLYLFPADIPTDQLPQVTIEVDGKQFNIEKEHLAFAAGDESGQWIFGGIQPRGNLDFDVLGDVFLQGVYAIFDVGKQRFGVVQRMDPTPAGPNTAGQKIKDMMRKATAKVEQQLQ